MSVLYPMKNYASELYRIYAYFETGTKAGGSLLIDCAKTEGEANQKKAEHEKRQSDLPQKERGHVYILHEMDWWMD